MARIEDSGGGLGTRQGLCCDLTFAGNSSWMLWLLAFLWGRAVSALSSSAAAGKHHRDGWLQSLLPTAAVFQSAPSYGHQLLAPWCWHRGAVCCLCCPCPLVQPALGVPGVQTGCAQIHLCTGFRPRGPAWPSAWGTVCCVAAVWGRLRNTLSWQEPNAGRVLGRGLCKRLVSPEV